VHGLEQGFKFGHVTDPIARELGYANLEEFHDSWVEYNDPEWFARWMDDGAVMDIADRFEQRWAPKDAWLIRFRLDHTAAPRMLAAAPSSYDPAKENDEGRDEDRGYTTSDSRSVPDEHPALTDDEWERHIGNRSAFREHARLRAQKAEREAASLKDRITRAEQAAKIAGHSLRSELWVLNGYLRDGKTDKARRQMERIEQRVFPTAA
jgi:hypothetical protein